MAREYYFKDLLKKDRYNWDSISQINIFYNYELARVLSQQNYFRLAGLYGHFVLSEETNF